MKTIFKCRSSELLLFVVLLLWACLMLAHSDHSEETLYPSHSCGDGQSNWYAVRADSESVTVTCAYDDRVDPD